MEGIFMKKRKANLLINLACFLLSCCFGFIALYRLKKVDSTNYFKTLTFGFKKISFDSEGFIIKFKDNRLYLIENSKNVNWIKKLNEPGEVLKYDRAQWVRLIQRDCSIYICDLYRNRRVLVDDLVSLKKTAPDAYFYQVNSVDRKKSFACIFVTKNLSEEKKLKLYNYITNRTNLVTQKSGKYYLAISPEYADILKKAEILLEAYRIKRAKQIKAHMKQLGMTNIEEYNEYMQNLRTKAMKEHMERTRVAREKKHRESQKRAAAAEKIRRKQSDEETRRYKERYKIEKEKKRKAREYAGLTKEQIVELEKKKKIVFEKSLRFLKCFEKGAPKSLRRIRLVMNSLVYHNRYAFNKYKHIPNYAKLIELYPNSEEPQLLDAAFKMYTQYDYNSGLSVLNNMKSTDNDPRAIKLKSLCLLRQGSYGDQKCIDYYTKLLKKEPDNKEYKEKIIKVKKYIEEKKKILKLGFKSYTEMKKAQKKWAIESKK
jgi:hypothetical protein